MQTLPDRSRVAIWSALGAALWLNALIVIRIFNAYGLLDGPRILIGFVLSMPLAVVTVWIFRLARTTWADMGFAITWGTAVAMLLDGVALGLMHGLYGETTDHARIAGSVILFGAAIGIFIAYWMAARRSG